jgi:hypothetical protein
MKNKFRNMKVKPIIIISSTLIIGFAIGFLASSMISHQRMKKFRSFNSVEAFKRRTIHLIEPNEKQMKEILPIIDKYAKEMDQIRKEFGKEFFNIMKDFYNDIKPFLTKEQIEKLEFIQRPPSRDSRHRYDSTYQGRQHEGKQSPKNK